MVKVLLWGSFLVLVCLVWHFIDSGLVGTWVLCTHGAGLGFCFLSPFPTHISRQRASSHVDSVRVKCFVVLIKKIPHMERRLGGSVG